MPEADRVRRNREVRSRDSCPKKGPFRRGTGPERTLGAFTGKAKCAAETNDGQALQLRRSAPEASPLPRSMRLFFLERKGKMLFPRSHTPPHWRGSHPGQIPRSHQQLRLVGLQRFGRFGSFRPKDEFAF